MASGGCLVMTSSGLGVEAHTSIVNEQYAHRILFSWVGALIPGGVHVGSIWLKDGEGLSETNKSIMEQITIAIAQLRGPWILGGDFNMNPKVISDSGWLDTIGGIIVAPLLPTCNQSTYDFFIVDKRLSKFILGIQLQAIVQKISI